MTHISRNEYRLLNSERLEAVFGQRLETRRLARNISQAQLATMAGVSRRTISRLENGDGVSLDTFIRVAAQLDLIESLLASLPEQEISPIDRVRMNGKQRQRARPAKTAADSAAAENASTIPAAAWTWGDEPKADDPA